MAYRPTLTLTPRLLRLVEEIGTLREKILAATVQVPWIPALQKDARVRSTHSSTAIEGNPLTLEDVRALEEGRDLPLAGARARREVINYFAGLRHIQKHQGKKLIRQEDILRLHAIVCTGGMDQGEPGRYRSIRVRVGRYVPPPPSEVSGMMAELLRWWNEQSREWPAVVSSAIVHHRFEDIHPFADGNGRVGRTLALWELYRRGFDTHHIFAIDEFYWEDRPRYYKALDSAHRKGGDLSAWVEYAAEGVHATLETVWRRVQRIAAESGPSKLVLRPKQEQLLQMLRDKKSLTPSEIWEGIGVSKQGAMNLINPLIEAGLVRRIGTRKSGRYLLA